MAITSRRARRPDSLAASVVEVLRAFQSPVPTDAMRVILIDRGREVTAEQLGSLAAYERQDWLRTLMPPRLCSVIDADANPIRPRWWALGDWRLERRIMTDDVRPIWFARLAVALCRELAERDEPRGSPIAMVALATAARAIGGRHIDVPTSRDEWCELHRLVYEPHMGALQNLAGPSAQQCEAEAKLLSAGVPAVDLYFGRRSR